MKLKTSLIAVGCTLLVQLPAGAATLTWSGGSNTWDTGTTADWSNGSAVTWTAGSDAVIGKGSDTAGTINLTTAGGVTASSLTFNAAGSGNYTLSGTTLNLSGTSLTLGTIIGFTNAATLLTANTSATINNYFNNTATAPTTSAWTVNSGATLTLGGGGSLQGSTKSFLTTGQGKIVFSSGTYTHSGQWDYINNANVEIGNATVNSANFAIAYGGGTTVVTLTNAKSVLSVSGAFEIGGRYGGVTGNGSLIVQSGTVNLSAGKELRIGGGIFNNGGTGLVDISGGTVTAPIVYIGYKGSSIASNGTLKIGGGSLTSGTIMLGGTSGSYLAGSSATLLMTSGTVNIGTGGIVSTSTPTNLTQSITLSGGVITATADWASSMAMALGTTNGNITFQAADASTVAHNITLNGVLSGSGGLTKTGSGVLALGGSNSYTGATNVSTGRLNVNGSLALGSAVSVGSGATLGGSGTANGTVGVTSGTITDTVALGATTFHGASTLAGTHTAASVTIADGTTTLSGTTTGGFTVSGATLAGSGKADGAVGVTNGTITDTVALGATTFHGASTLAGTHTAASVTIADGTTTLSGTTTGGFTVNGATLAGSGKADGAVGVANGTINGSGLNLGATTFTGTSTLSGTTTAASIAISAGATTVSSGASASAATVSVSGSATLTNNGTVTGAVDVTGVLNGTGTVNGSLTIKSTGELAPGNSPGITTVTGALVVEGGAKVSMQIDGTAGAGATGGFDQIIVESTGSVKLNAGSILNISLSTSLASNTTITLIDNKSVSILDGTFTQVYFNDTLQTLAPNNTFTADGVIYQLSYESIADADGIANDLTLAVVPEPSTWAMIVGGMGMVIFSNRLRRRSRI